MCSLKDSVCACTPAHLRTYDCSGTECDKVAPVSIFSFVFPPSFTLFPFFVYFSMCSYGLFFVLSTHLSVLFRIYNITIRFYFLISLFPSFLRYTKHSGMWLISSDTLQHSFSLLLSGWHFLFTFSCALVCIHTSHTQRNLSLFSLLSSALSHSFSWLAYCFFSYLVVSFPYVFLFNDVCACVRACVGARACTFWLYILLLLTFLIFIIPVIAISFDYFLHIYILRRDLYFTWCFWCCNYIFVWRRVIRVFYFTFILEVIMLFIMFVWLLRPHAVIYILHRIYFIYTYIYRKGLYRYSILVILRINISFLFVQYFIYIVPWSLVLVVLGLRVYIIRVYN